MAVTVPDKCAGCGQDEHGGEHACLVARIHSQVHEIRGLKFEIAKLRGALRAYRPDEPAQGMAPPAPPLKAK